MISRMKNEEGGFLQLVVFIIAAVFFMSYFNISISDIVGWFQEVF